MSWQCIQCGCRDSVPHFANEDIRVCKGCGHQNGNPFSGPTFATDKEVSTITVEKLAETMDEMAKKFPKPKFGVTTKELAQELEQYPDDHCVVLLGNSLWVIRPDIAGISPIQPVVAKEPELERLIPTEEMELQKQIEVNKARELLFHWQHKPGTNFGSMLFTMFQKADPQNMRKLKTGFPVEHAVWHEWYMSEDPDKLFEQWGLK